MGPITLFDKSFLQALTLDESVWFDNFFYSVVCPIFYVESLADLKKSKPRRAPEQEVGIIADKFPEMHGTPTANHRDMALGDLLGHHVPLTGQIPIAGGRLVKSGERKGVVHDHSPETDAFLRWQSREFYDIEHQFASVWRASLESLDLNSVADGFRQLGISGHSCKSFSEAKSIADALVNGSGQPFERMKLVILFLDVPARWHESILRRWSISNYPPLSKFSPYAAYVLTVEVFFQISLAANLISSDRPSNRLDIAYLYYLPFCMTFVSSDRLHRRCAAHFLREDQSLIWGPDLKNALSDLNEHYSALPEKEREEGLMSFASYPPTESESIVSQAWDRHMPGWRERAKEPWSKPEPNPELVKELTEFSKAPALQPDAVDFDPDNADMRSIGRRVSKRKGRWWQLPRALEVNDDEEG